MSEDLVERRRPDQQVETLTQILKSVSQLHLKLEEVQPIVQGMRQELREHIEDETVSFKTAFPEGDPEGHRRAHEAQIRKAEAEAKEAEDRAQIILAAKKKAAEMTVYGVLFAVCVVFVFFWNGHMPSSAHMPMPKP